MYQLYFIFTYSIYSYSTVFTLMLVKKKSEFSGNVEWTKKNINNDLFDVTMGSFDGPEICEI